MKAQPIHGFGIGGYKSFSGEPQLVGPFKKINIFIGENNSGKSNVLRFIRDVYRPIASKQSTLKPISGTSLPQGGQNSEFVPILLPASDDYIRSLRADLEPHEIAAIKTILSANATDDNCIILFSLPRNSIFFDVERIASRISNDGRYYIQRAWAKVTNNRSGDLKVHWIPEIIDWYYKSSMQSLPTLHYVPTLRQIPTKLEEFEKEYGGVTQAATIADDLAALAQPDHKRPQDRAKFDTITAFMCSVLKRPTLKLSVPHDKSTIIVEDYGRYLPIESLGTGLHQLLILAIRAVLVDNAVICIEEPELHMHPELQQQLMHFISTKTSNQYFITTHSATIMDAVDADVYSVRLDGPFSKIEKPLTRVARRSICHTLGYRPSDLLQANSIVWVEGPTDRLYLVNWLKSVAHYLEEGWHFSIMFYGGKLASHLTVESDGSDLIELLPINRFPAILMDSDKKRKGQHINSTKERLSSEFEKVGGFAWITKGREIENYISLEVRQSSINKISGINATISEDVQYGHPLAFIESSSQTVPDKLLFARTVCATPLSLDVLDLKQQVTKLAQFICQANNIEYK